MNSIEQIAPCPFCGGEAVAPTHDDEFEAWRCGCSACNAHTWADTEDEAIAAWNRRTAQAELVEALDNLLDLYTRWRRQFGATQGDIDSEVYVHDARATLSKYRTDVRDVRFKAMEHDFDQDELIAEIKARGTVQFNDFRLITGACESGLKHGMDLAGLDPNADELPLATVLSAAFGHYGEQFKALFREELAA